ncbi:MAG: hypothetical protein HOP03_16155 [Lysobacter sp.]|nr:hypothetical protein [Lysobacter sp.]
MSKPCLPIAIALLCTASAHAAQPPVGADDLLNRPDPQIERPGSSGPGQGELEMEQELQLAGIRIPWGGDADVPAGRADGKRDGLCVFRYRYVTRNTDSTASHPTSTRITLGARNGAVLHGTLLPSIASVGSVASSGKIALAPGHWVLYVQIDATDRMIERDETNNLRRVGVTVRGDCGARALRASPY